MLAATILLASAVPVSGTPTTETAMKVIQAELVNRNLDLIVVSATFYEEAYRPKDLHAKSPLIRGDFNRDGKQDIAVLLRTRKVFERREVRPRACRWCWWQKDRQIIFRHIETYLGVFLSDGDSGHELVWLWEREKYNIPLCFSVESSPWKILGDAMPGDGEDNKEAAKVKSGDVLFVGYCEKSSWAYFWDAQSGKFRKIWLSD